MRNARRRVRTRVVAVLLLMTGGAVWIRNREASPMKIHVVDTSTDIPRGPGPVVVPAQFSESPSEPIAHPATPYTDRLGEWLSVSPVQRKSWISPEAMEPFETILASLRLSGDRLLRLQELMVERRECAQNAESLSQDEKLSPEATARLHEEAEAAFDREIAEIVGAPNIEKVQQMLSLEPQLAQISHTVGRDLGLTGNPLSADQMLQLAQIYKEIYAPTTGGHFDRMEGFDPRTGLAVPDRDALSRASAVLNPQQLDLLEANLAKATTAYADAGQ